MISNFYCILPRYVRHRPTL